MGTPDFAVESLRALVEGGYNVVAVVTMPDKPAGRGHQLQYSAVKQYALSATSISEDQIFTKPESFCTLIRAPDINAIINPIMVIPPYKICWKYFPKAYLLYI